MVQRSKELIVLSVIALLLAIVMVVFESYVAAAGLAVAGAGLVWSLMARKNPRE